MGKLFEELDKCYQYEWLHRNGWYTEDGDRLTDKEQHFILQQMYDKCPDHFQRLPESERQRYRPANQIRNNPRAVDMSDVVELELEEKSAPRRSVSREQVVLQQEQPRKPRRPLPPPPQVKFGLRKKSSKKSRKIGKKSRTVGKKSSKKSRKVGKVGKKSRKLGKKVGKKVGKKSRK